MGVHGALGPGKIHLLELIGKHGSISEAGRVMGMSYRRAWRLVDELNSMFREPVVAARAGGARGGGTHLTELGEEVVRRYRRMERKTAGAVEKHLRALEARLATAPPEAEGKEAAGTQGDKPGD
ncbi:LysR family transcriptional regulator [Rhizobiales bacterium L72]|uniref:LysR family transcriptional regulator n=2 Tax=Propylenella binzhouense TaxID=2555902 RepID=A0A964T892_9HYPH|nr:LysR family transcriptional regulator [Propylenella binzhouense]MYZ50289.1 LysR family transcriptional regulator [Propylenella binzhouense]